MTTDSRIKAIKALISDEVLRVEKAQWKQVFERNDLEPPTQSDAFSHQMQALLQVEMDEGYKRKIEQKKALKEKGSSSLSGRYLENTFHITPTVGRFIFAVFGWHDLSKFPVKKEKFIELAEAFNFKIKPEENELQFLNKAEREQALDKLSDRDQDEQNWMLIGVFLTTVFAILAYLSRKLL